VKRVRFDWSADGLGKQNKKMYRIYALILNDCVLSCMVISVLETVVRKLEFKTIVTFLVQSAIHPIEFGQPSRVAPAGRAPRAQSIFSHVRGLGKA